MNPNDLHAGFQVDAVDLQPDEGAALLSPLLRGTTHVRPADRAPSAAAMPNVVIGELLALADDGATPLVRYPGNRAPAPLRRAAASTCTGRTSANRCCWCSSTATRSAPVVIGVLRGATGWPDADKPAQVDVDVDGQRMIVSAKEQLVLRCGKASITLTKAGKVLIEGSYVLSRSTGVNRIKGGSVQLN